MNHLTKCKLWYALYSIPMTLKLKLKGIATSGLVYTGGTMYAYKVDGSTISIGRKCRFMSKHIGNQLGINHPCIISTANKGAVLEIGDGCSFSGVGVRCFKSIRLGRNVRVGANVLIMDGDSHQDDPRAGEDKPIVIEDNVWIGANVTIMKGVTIGKNSLIETGSIVTKSIPENVVAAGNPCKVLRPLTQEVIEQLNTRK